MLLKRKRRFQLKKSRVMEKEKEEKKKEEEEVVRYLAEKGLSVLETAEKGRCLYTTKPFNPGEVIIRQQPYICVPNNSLRCQVCFTSLNVKTKRCSACHLVSYCGTTCQKADWTLHRLECQALSKLPIQKRNYLTPSILLMLKLYFKRILQGQKVIPTTVTDNYTMLETLVSHMLEIDEKQLVLYAQMANLVYAILQWPELELKEVTENFSKIFMELNYWKDALAYCRMTIPVYEKVYIGCHPMLRLQYYTCGRLEWLLGETDNCVKSLTKALDILRITHGTTTPFVKELLVKLEEARAEASFKLKPVDEE